MLRHAIPVLLVASALGSAGCSSAGAEVPRAPASSTERAMAMTHVTLIDPASGPRPDVTIVMAGHRITAVGPSASTPVPEHAQVHDETGHFAVPGFWDAHVHLTQMGMDLMPLFVANGITSVRDMGSTFEDIVRWKQARTAGQPAPRVFAPGPKIDGKGESWGDNWIITSPESARRAVDDLKAYGVDFIKVHAGLSRPIYDALADESRKKGLFFSGHVGGDYPAAWAAKSGQRTIEHGSSMVPCSNAERAQLRADPKLVPLMKWVCADSNDDVLPELARAGVWLTPTLVSWRGKTMMHTEAPSLEGYRYVSAALEKRWLGDGEETPPLPIEREVLAQFGPLAARAHRAGVHLLVGTDIGDPYVVPGFGLHDEMQLLVEAGIPPLVALRSATLEAARALGVDATTGTIEVGKSADVVVLDADPLANIRNTRRIDAVVQNGQWLDRAKLTALLEPLTRTK
ncbi:amidohydrolase family protein [Pendulispora brunnea]|uniref:Amidohydrolase family protein n=1 Tax=Pendulispora brunnea TaxID=2905690 RepID=A0ABZ2K7T8_9BACT